MKLAGILILIAAILATITIILPGHQALLSVTGLGFSVVGVIILIRSTSNDI